MSRVILYPYPRLSSSQVNWSAWSASLEGKSIALPEIADNWDANAGLSFQVSVSVPRAALEALGVEVASGRLVVTVSCRDTARTETAATSLIGDAASASGTATVTVSGRDVAEALDLRAHVLASGASETPASRSWLSRRILAEAPVARVPLDSTLDGFPTVAFSFDAERVPEAPWRLTLSADDLEAPFAHSIRLELNEDYPVVRSLMDGVFDPRVERELVATITRVLIGSVARLMSESTGRRSPDDVAVEAPDSIAAAAQRAARQHLRMSLEAAVRERQMRPERFEHMLANGLGTLKER